MRSPGDGRGPGCRRCGPGRRSAGPPPGPAHRNCSPPRTGSSLRSGAARRPRMSPPAGRRPASARGSSPAGRSPGESATARRPRSSPSARHFAGGPSRPGIPRRVARRSPRRRVLGGARPVHLGGVDVGHAEIKAPPHRIDRRGGVFVVVYQVPWPITGTSRLGGSESTPSHACPPPSVWFPRPTWPSQRDGPRSLSRGWRVSARCRSEPPLGLRPGLNTGRCGRPRGRP